MSKTNTMGSSQQTILYRISGSTRGMGWEDVKAYARPFLAPMGWGTMEGVAQHLPCTKFLDLSIYYYVQLGSSSADRTEAAWVDIATLETWGITMQELQAQAVENLKSDGYSIQDIGSILDGYLGNCTYPDNIDAPPLYVLTNQKCFLGAAGILDKTMVASFAGKIGKNLYLIPSSIHEFLLCPDLGLADKEELDQIVGQVNDTQVPPYERLSNHVYYYDRGLDEIREER